ncbi:phosphoglycolate phosphatase [Tamaricihabitans halophyticus]|uniref:Phosphoglycolate phosphatase n=1 Tax=Tamaricihabitans halophyticus TaxID=1262583 RepID=A0A4R2R4D9_9PSEU|nr:HAD hydrolase-like protein [Tamaricihabitans halophyticus]TCP56558.1 phosphoglycolate phosphatase [Tamaricihabitans halophyticus]
MAFTVGFDLDMTLIDPRPGMARVLTELSAESGIPLDGERFAANLGPPLDEVFRDMAVPEERIQGLVDRFRALYPEYVVPATVALPGAHAALRAVSRLGGRAIVVTGKYGPNAWLHVNALELPVDEVVGGLWATGKADALLEYGARVYVGDHVGDMRGARAAGAIAVGVATGPCTPAELGGAGADVLLDDLCAFPGWLAELPDPV